MKNYQLDTEELALDSVCQKLQLDKTRSQTLDRAYDSVTKWLEDDQSFWGHDDRSTLLYPYGSRELGTVVKPKSHEEYDIDFAVQIDDECSNYSREELRQKLFDRLDEHGMYKGKLKLIRFGVRINYEGQLHMDIMPGCLVGNRRLKVPDCKKDVWAIRNLKGYSQWFKSKFVQDVSRLPLYEAYKLRGLIIEAKAETESLPRVVNYAAIQPIQKAVQLLKRHRNIYFENREDEATSSVILTTLAGDHYNGSTSIIETVDGILKSILSEVAVCRASGRKLRVVNPADRYLMQHEQEVLSSKWEEPGGGKLYNFFQDFIRDMNVEWTKLQLANTKSQKIEILKKLFGETIGKEISEDRNIWGDRIITEVPYDMPYVKHGASKTTPWLKR